MRKYIKNKELGALRELALEHQVLLHLVAGDGTGGTSGSDGEGVGQTGGGSGPPPTA